MTIDPQARLDLMSLAAALRGENPALLADLGQRRAWAELVESVLPAPTTRERQNVDKVLAWQFCRFGGMSKRAAAQTAVRISHPELTGRRLEKRIEDVRIALAKGFDGDDDVLGELIG